MVGILSPGQISHGNRSELYRRLEVLAKFRPLAARGSAQLLNLVRVRCILYPRPPVLTYHLSGDTATVHVVPVLLYYRTAVRYMYSYRTVVPVRAEHLSNAQQISQWRWHGEIARER